jgi:hypothetical protein
MDGQDLDNRTSSYILIAMTEETLRLELHARAKQLGIDPKTCARTSLIPLIDILPAELRQDASDTAKSMDLSATDFLLEMVAGLLELPELNQLN